MKIYISNQENGWQKITVQSDDDEIIRDGYFKFGSPILGEEYLVLEF